MADPDGDREAVVGHLDLTPVLAIQMTAVGALGLIVALAAFSGVYHAATGHPASLQFSRSGVGWNAALDALAVVVLGTAVVVPHEWSHGLAIRYYGGKPRYGVGLAHFVLPYAYATTDHEFTRNQFVVVLLTPLVALTAVGVPAMVLTEWGWLVVPLATNAAGAVVDLWMALTVLGFPADARVEDHATGVRIRGRERARPGLREATVVAWDALAGTAVTAVGTLLLLGLLGPPVLSALGAGSVTVGTPGTVTYLFSYADTPTGVSLGAGPGVLGLGAVVGLTYAFVRSHRRRRRSTDERSEDSGTRR